jgi:ribonucleoside-diphosphate reductase subunit M2
MEIDFKKYLAKDIDIHEDILRDIHNKNVTFPIRFPKLWEHYKRQTASFWTAEEIDLKNDREHFNTRLNDNERHFIKHVLAFFAASDGIIMENISGSFLNDVKITELIYIYGYQNFIEQIHGEVYSLLIDTLIDTDNEKKNLFNALSHITSIKRKAEWASKYINKDLCFACRIFANACVEGIFFSGSFCAIFWLKERGILPGLIFSNELISRDEGDHVTTPQLVFELLRYKPDIEYVHEIVKEAVEIESMFIKDAIPVELIGMNATLMLDYIKFVSDRLLVQFGYPKLYHVENPFSFMERISLKSKANFFEKRVSEYSKASIANKMNGDDNSFTLEADF